MHSTSEYVAMQGIFKYVLWEDIEPYLRYGWEPVEMDYYRDQFGCGMFFQCCDD